jgi:hypothetical protein
VGPCATEIKTVKRTDTTLQILNISFTNLMI